MQIYSLIINYHFLSLTILLSLYEENLIPFLFANTIRVTVMVFGKKKIGGVALKHNDVDIRKEIDKRLHDMAKQEAGSGWQNAAMFLGNEKAMLQLIAQMSKAQVDQNKVLIMQNELLYRELARIRDNTKLGP
jgi:hypothetical protein